jgi:hypothetical protein
MVELFSCKRLQNPFYHGLFHLEPFAEVLPIGIRDFHPEIGEVKIKCLLEHYRLLVGEFEVNRFYSSRMPSCVFLGLIFFKNSRIR